MTTVTSTKRVRGWTKEEAEEQLQIWKDAYTKIAVNGQNYTIGNRSLGRADLKTVEEQIEKFGDILNDFETGNPSRVRIRHIIQFDR